MEVEMVSIELQVNEDLLRKARQYADEHNTTLEAFMAEHPAVLAIAPDGA
jgi:hypothetical protein